MHPKKKQKISPAAEAKSPEIFVANSRDAVITKLKKEARQLGQEEDYYRLLESVRALIDTNNEIWQRCLPNKVPEELITSTGIRFYRVGFLTVKVNTVEKRSRDSKNIVFGTTAEIATEEFKRLPQIPEVLSCIFSLQCNGNLPDYEQYLEKASWLQEDISKPFLIILKEHLKEMQVALGEIDSWLLEPCHALNFINENFGQRLELPELGEGCNDSGNDIKESSICVNCFQPKSKHHYYDASATRCPRKENLNFIDFLKLPVRWGAFFVPPAFTIKKANMRYEDEVTMSFKVCSEPEQERLRRFLHFVDADAGAS